MNKKINIIDNRIGDNLEGLLNLFEFVKSKIGPKNIIELGSFIGTSTKLFSNFFPNSNIYAVDLWKNDFDLNDPICRFDLSVAEKMFDENTKNCLNVVKIKMDTNHFSTIIKDDYFDFIYVDADHSYEGAKKNNQNFYSKIKVGGILSGHDYNKEKYSEVKKVVDELFGVPKFQFKDSSWALVKKN